MLSVPTPTNVAAWGDNGDSGKSVVVNLLKGLLGRPQGVRFDAFKYAENPLRRNSTFGRVRYLHLGGRAVVCLGGGAELVGRPAPPLHPMRADF